MNRKSPIIHKVKTHTRNGKQVHSYVRGHRKTTFVTRVSKPLVKRQTPKGFTIKLRYSDKPHDLETVKVIATSYKRAIDEAFEEKLDKRMPIEITVIDPSIGEIIHWVGDKAAKYGKYAVETSAKYAKERVKESVSDYRIKLLVDDAYSENKARRALARAKLRRDHPEVWDVMDISKS